MNKKLKLFCCLASLFIVSLFLVGCHHDEKTVENEAYRVIQVVETSGDVEIDRPEVGIIKAYEKMNLQSQDSIRVGEDSYLRLLLDNDKYIYVESNTQLTLEATGTESQSYTNIKLLQGAITNEIQNALSDTSEYKITTPNSTMSVRGTVYYVEVIQKEDHSYTSLKVFNGIVETHLLDKQGKESEPLMVEMGKEVLVHGDEKIREYVVFDNGKTQQDISINDLNDETLKNIYSISQNNDNLYFKSENIENEILKRNNQQYKLSFYDRDQLILSRIVSTDEDIPYPQLQRRGYTLIGWYEDQDYRTPFTSQTLSSDYNLYAKWNANDITLTLKDYGALTRKADSSITLPIPIREGHTFVGWYEDAMLIKPANIKTMPTKNQTLYAKWNANDITLTLEDYGTLTRKVDSPITLPTPTREGYTFGGWYEDATLFKPVNIKTMPTRNQTLYAKWIANDIILTLKDYGTLTRKADSSITLPTPTREGYIFDGWYYDEALTQSVMMTTMPTRDQTLYAKWNPRADTPYKVAYWHQKIGGDAQVHDSQNYELVSTDSFNGTTGSQVSPDVKSFIGMTSPKKQTMVIDANGQSMMNYYYTRNTYTLSLVKGEGIEQVTGSRNYLYGENVNISAILKSGYTWQKWVSQNSNLVGDIGSQNTSIKMPAGSLTFTAKANPEQYQITYHLNEGELPDSYPTQYNVTTSNITLPIPTRDHHTFMGWYDNSQFNGSKIEIIPQGSIGHKTYYAKWAENDIEVTLVKADKSEETLTYSSLQEIDTTKWKHLSSDEDFIGWSKTEKYDQTQLIQPQPLTLNANATYYEMCYVKYDVKYKFEKYDYGMSDSYYMPTLSMKGILGEKVNFIKYAQKQTLVPANYDAAVVPSEIDLTYGTEKKTYEIMYKVPDEELLKKEIHYGMNMYTRYYLPNDQYIGLDTTIINEFGGWRRTNDSTLVDFIESLINILTGHTNLYFTTENNDSSFKNIIIKISKNGQVDKTFKHMLKDDNVPEIVLFGYEFDNNTKSTNGDITEITMNYKPKEYALTVGDLEIKRTVESNDTYVLPEGFTLFDDQYLISIQGTIGDLTITK